MRSTPIYTATAKLHIQYEAPRIVDIERVDPYASKYFLETQIEILKSRAIAKQVIDQLGLFAKHAEQPDNPAIEKPKGVRYSVNEFIEYLKSFVSPHAPEPPADEAQREEMMMSAMINGFLAGLRVAFVPSTDIVVITYSHPNPEFCSTVANAICDAYIRRNYQTKSESYNYASSWIEQKTEEVKAKLESSEEGLYKIAGSNDILQLSDNAASLQATYNATEAQLEATEQALSEKEFALKAMQKGQFPIEMDLTRLRELEAQLAQRDVEYDQARQQYGPQMAAVKTIAAARDRLREQIAEEKSKQESQRGEEFNKALLQAQFDYEQTKARRDYLAERYAELEKRLIDIQQQLIQFNILKREVDVNKELYNSLLQRAREVGVTSGLEASNVSIVERAERPLAPITSDRNRKILLGALLGVFMGIGLVFFREYMDTSVRGPSDIERIAQLSTLGLLPHIAPSRRGGPSKSRPELMMHQEPKSAFAEQVRSLRTSLQYSLAGHPPKTILITSALPGEGKTTVSSNLAISMAQRGLKTLLIDADLKKPQLYKLYGLSRSDGLTDVLTGKLSGDLQENAIHKTEIERLSVMPSGSPAPNPVDLLDSQEMRNLLVTLEGIFDQIVIDAPPTLDLADTGVLIPYVDGVALVAKPGKTPRAAVAKVKDQLSRLGARVLGVVLNDRRMRSGRRYYGYGRQRYGYGGSGSYYYGQERGESMHAGPGAGGKDAVPVPFKVIDE